MSEPMLFMDPGETTGWSLWNYEETLPLMRLEWGYITGGFEGVMDWGERHLGLLRPDIYCERFDPLRGNNHKNFEPMLIEGGLRAIARALGLPFEYQDTGMKALCTDETLRRNGLWIENSEVEHEDARDINDSQIHALAWGKSHDHQPTIERYWPDLT